MKTEKSILNKSIHPSVIVASFACMVLLLIYLKACRSNDVPNSLTTLGQMQKDDKIAAWTMAQGFIEERLKSPGTADWGSLSQNPLEQVTQISNDTYKVHGWVDSQNSFGAMSRINFTLTIKNVHGDKWELVGEPLMVQR